MLTQLRTEQLLTKLVLGRRLSPEECRRVRGYLETLLAEVSKWEYAYALEEAMNREAEAGYRG